MSILREILAEAFLLREDASIDAINAAINNMRPVRIVYNGPSGAGNGQRVIYPVAYGLSTAGNPVVRAFQPQGSTASEVPAWKFFRLDRIKSWRNINSRTFNPAQLNGFNEDGDEQMETIYAISPIGQVNVAKPDNNVEKGNEPEKILTTHPVTKGEVDNGGADKGTETQYYTANDAMRDLLSRAMPKNMRMEPKNVDNVAGQDYTSTETQPVADPHPITKGEVGGQENVGNETPGEPVETDNGPVLKTDLETPKEDSLAAAFSDMTNRMNNLYKEDEKEEM